MLPINPLFLQRQPVDDARPVRATHFKQNCLAWATLVHFLPADLLRELCYVTVDLLSAGQFTLADLFDERLLTGSDGFDIWEIRPREVSEPLAQYLQRRIRTFAWGTDSYVSFEESSAASTAIKPSFLENAVQLGIVDLSSPEYLVGQMTFPHHQPSIQILRDGIAKARGAIVSSEDAFNLPVIDAIFREVEMPLAAVMVKHLGDLCADADHWQAAHRFYDQANKQLGGFESAIWKTFCDALKAVTTQSIAAALRSAEGPRSAADYLVPKVESVSLNAASLLIANASQDAYVAASLASDSLFAPDRRAHLVLPPLCLSSHDLASALQAAIEEDYADAHRRFWQVLRRQIALGSASESRLTKAFYARAIFEELDKTATRHSKPDAFLMATRLLIESGQSVVVEKMSWSEELIRSYVDHNLVEAAIAHARKSGGAPGERLNTLVEMLKGWTEVTVIERADVAHAMINFLAVIAKENRSSFYGSRDVGGQSIKRIRQLADIRPEFRVGTALEVTAAIVAKLQAGEWWTAVQEAMKAADLYAQVLSDENLTRVVSATLSLLNPIDPAKDVWVIVQPALDFLSSHAVKQWSVRHPELAERVVTTILNFGINQQTEHARLLFFLHDFDLSLLSGKASSSQLAELVADVRNKAKTTNASDSVNNIRALLICPAVSGAAGVRDALQALETVFRSALIGRPSLSFSASYEGLLLLAERFSQIAEALALRPEVFRTWLQPLLAAVTQVWIKAKDDPMIFAQFSLPPQTKPNAVVVHNWAFASISFAKVLGREGEILQVLAVAAEQSQLTGSIAKARASRLAAGDFEEIDAATILAENRETFYAALGQRLVRVRRMTQNEPIVRAFLDQCLRYGPNGLDAAVLLLAEDLKLGETKDNPHYVNYERRLENSRDLRLALSPLLHALSKAPK
jgi:hypothetical protein